MKILHIIPSVSPVRGGPSKDIIEMVSALNKLGIDTEIATTNDDGDQEMEVTLDALDVYQGVPVRFFQRFSPPISALREFAYSGDFRRWLKANIERYDVIHVHAIFSFTSSYAMYLARKRGIAYVVRPIGQLDSWSLKQSSLRKWLFLTLFEKRSLLKAAKLHFTAELEQQQAHLAIPELTKNEASTVVPLGIEPNPELNNARESVVKRHRLDPNKRVLLYLSRLHPKKGLELLLQSLSQVNNTRWQLLIAGDGDNNYVNHLKHKIEELGLRHHCQFIGFVRGDEKDTLLQGADLYILTSYSENFGIAVLEAIAAGTQVLISEEVALAATVRQHKLGFVCNLEVNSVTQNLNLALQQQNNAAQRAREYVIKHHSWEAIARTLSELYQRVGK